MAEPRSGNSRREVLRRGLALGLGTGVLVATSQLITATPARAEVQSGWRYCTRCRSLVWGGSGGGDCAHPNYSTHSWNNSYSYVMHYKPDPIENSGQDQWAYCRDCKGMFFHYYADVKQGGYCEYNSGGPHDGLISADYVMPLSPADDRQGNWRYCINCDAMFWGGQEANSHCPTGGPHDRGASWNYYLQYTIG